VSICFTISLSIEKRSRC